MPNQYKRHQFGGKTEEQHEQQKKLYTQDTAETVRHENSEATRFIYVYTSFFSSMVLLLLLLLITVTAH